MILNNGLFKMKNRSILHTSFIITIMIFIGMMASSLQSQGLEDIIYEIQVNGLKSLSREYVISKIRSREGSYFYPSVIKEDIKLLYNTGQFSMINFETKKTARGIVLVIDVTEKPVLSSIVFEGNSKLKDSALRKLMKSSAGSPADEAKIKQDILAITNKYIEKGFPNITVDYKLEVVSAKNEASLRIIIDEGQRLKIGKIKFEGNTAFKDKELLRLMKTKKDTLWPFNVIFKTGILDEEAFAEDIERIENYYHYKGYLDAKITDIKRDTPAKKKKMVIVITVVEGPTYNVGAIDIAGNSTFPTRSINELIASQPSTLYSPEKLGNDVNSIQNYYADRGYIEARVNTKVTYDSQTQTMNLAYRINESTIFYVNKVNIRGNYKTKDKVIRRELLVYPGEIFDGSKLRTSQKRLENTGFFEKVTVLMDDVEGQKDRKDVVMDIQEKKTGSISFGAGFSSIDSLVGFTELSQSNFDLFNFRNFQGAGQKFRIRLEAGTERQNFLISFTEPYFLDKQLMFGTDLYVDRSEYLSDDYDEDRVGVAFRLGKSLANFLRGEVSLALENIDVKVDDEASPELLAEDAEYNQASVSFRLTHDTRDQILFPTRGAQTLAILKLSGGDAQYSRFDLRTTHYFTPFSRYPNHIIKLRHGFGVAGEMSGDDVPIFDRMFLGGPNTVRGFEFREIGPQDVNDEPLGGKVATWGSIEYLYPIIDRIQGAFFLDGGNVHESLSDVGEDINVGAGLGARLNLPIGPIRIDYGFPIVTDDYTDDDAEPRFHFGMGTSF
ncbi:MAG: outer membrane protein assembly factor BamA [Candidatus Auribacterota bacterium]